MKRRAIIALALAVAMMTVACGKPKDEKKKLDVYGYKMYSVDPQREKQHTLLEEYDNRGTERNRLKYNSDGEVTERRKLYYDDTGEYLLKEVIKLKDGVTESREYDFRGRCIKVMATYEDGYYPGGSSFMEEGKVLKLPESYWVCNSDKYDLQLQRFNSLREVSLSKLELITEYTYQGDTDEVISICTKDGDGKVVAVLERGEGEIVLSEVLDCTPLRYEETYDTATQTGIWKCFNGETIEYYGEKKYDPKNRCVLYTSRKPQEHEYTECTFEYEEDGYWETRCYIEEDTGAVTEKSRFRFDYEGRKLVRESYRCSYGKQELESRETTEYLKDGRICTRILEGWTSGRLSMGTRNDTEYDDENGITREYVTDFTKPEEQQKRVLYKTTQVSFSTDDSLGKIRITEETSRPMSIYINQDADLIVTDIIEDADSTITRKYEVCLPDMDDRTKENWVCYYSTATYTEDGITKTEELTTYKSGEDENWLTVFTKEPAYYYNFDCFYYNWDADVYDGYTPETSYYTVTERYNKQGLLCERRKTSESGETKEITMWEHWEE